MNKSYKGYNVEHTDQVSDPKPVSIERETYEAPAIIYSGRISTRAGTPEGSGQAIDPQDLFGGVE